MKKIIKYVFVALLGFTLVSFNNKKVDAKEDDLTFGSVDLIDVYQNPEKYQNIEIELYDGEQFVQHVIMRNEDLSPEKKEMLIMDIIKQSKAAGKVEWANVKEQITVTSSYKPSVYFYLQFEWDSAHVSSPTPCRISKVEYADLNRVYGTTTKQFAGTLKYNLETGNSLYWDLNGDFYNNGTTTLSGGVSIGIGGSSTISFNASVTSGYYSGVCEQSKYRPAIHG